MVNKRNLILVICFVGMITMLIQMGSLIIEQQTIIQTLQETKTIDIIPKITNTVKHFRNGILIHQYGDTEVLTNIGKNLTAFKISGDTDWIHAGSMLKNVTFMGWGDQGSLSASSTVLPNEITRYDVSANFTYIAIGKWNYTAYWKPTGSGNVDCVGMYWHSSGNVLYVYDVFGQVAYTTADEFYSYWQFEITYT